MFSIYIWIDGVGFDADAFQKAVGGVVSSRKRMRDGSVDLGDRFWKSATIRIESGSPEDELHKLLIDMEQDLTRLAKVPEIRIVAEIVEYVSANESVRGFFISAETIRLLAQIGVALDFDIVCDTEGSKR